MNEGCAPAREREIRRRAARAPRARRATCIADPGSRPGQQRGSEGALALAAARRSA